MEPKKPTALFFKGAKFLRKIRQRIENLCFDQYVQNKRTLFGTRLTHLKIYLSQSNLYETPPIINIIIERKLIAETFRQRLERMPN